ncbi:amidohydrolase [Intrasporangium sp. YIM S08009]|uniref:amidohydrolase n=1 Tax=Intrasporangium zincisolvens TaxID=3080018 RepID=UPI002B05B73F|nr:amidohydrolase [Intrasporangium sp. YIM S08009]
MTDAALPLPFDAIGRVVDQHVAELVAFRRDLHTHPELGRGEVRTTAAIADRLETAGIRVRRLRGTGLVADLGASDPAQRIALRADIDALPIREATGLDFASGTDGVSHSCGHDVHTTALLGAALALKNEEARLVASGIGARLVFQPAEELMPGGAEDVVAQDGLVGVDRIFALHCDPNLDAGQVGLRVGPITAAADQVEVVLVGRGGHTSRPHLTQDLTYALAKVVTDVPAVLSRRLDPRAGAALVWGSVHSGGAHNVIPSSGKVGGTLRMLDASIWDGVERLLEEVVHAVVSPYAVHAEVTITKGVPPVVNDAGCIDALTAAVTGAGAFVAPTPQSLGGEDFAWYLTHVPGAMARLGTRTPGGPTYDLHRGDLVVDEAAIPIGARTLAGVVFSAAAARTVDADRPRRLGIAR